MIRREFLAGLTSLSALAAAPAVSFAQAPMNLGQQWDVIVIGSGLAGLSAALSASETVPIAFSLLKSFPCSGGTPVYLPDPSLPSLRNVLNRLEFTLR